MEPKAGAWIQVIASQTDPEADVAERGEDWVFHAPVAFRLAQVIHHGTDHRSQVCTILSTLGIEPPEIDVWAYGEATGGRAPRRSLRPSRAPDEWSINDNLAHLRASADVWGKYMGRIVAEDHPTFTSINPRAHMRKTDYPDLEFAPSFRAFSVQRDALIAMLEACRRRAGTERPS